jgi:putative glutamine amidotransferase
MPILHERGARAYIQRLHYNHGMPPRIAIPVPHSEDSEYAGRALPQYMHAIEMAGGEPVRIPLDQPLAEIKELIEGCDGVVLPGSKADIDPAKYRAAADPHTAPADSKRDGVDDLLLRDAYAAGKPVLGICYGLQILNVYHGGTLLQHIESPINHEAGKSVPVAHTVNVETGSRLGAIVSAGGKNPNNTSGKDALSIAVNSSHHQAAEVVGNGLRIVARCPEDGIIEALEGESGDHFVVAVQWHPERSVKEDEASRAIFDALVKAAQTKRRKTTGELTI